MTKNKGYKSRLQTLYEKHSKKMLQDTFNYKNLMQIPALDKVVVSVGVKDAVHDSKIMEQVYTELFAITGQKPLMRRAKKSIASFKLRQGMPIGYKVTLRRHMMWEFLDRLINIALPRSKDFRGFSVKQFDSRGNYSLGITEQLIFPEINYDKVDKIMGMNIAIVTTAQSDNEAKVLLDSFNFPFSK